MNHAPLQNGVERRATPAAHDQGAPSGAPATSVGPTGGLSLGRRNHVLSTVLRLHGLTVDQLAIYTRAPYEEVELALKDLTRRGLVVSRLERVSSSSRKYPTWYPAEPKEVCHAVV